MSKSAAGDEAFVWTESAGMRCLKEVLEGYGRDSSGWHFIRADAVSSDGAVVVGYGINPQGDTEAFMVDISPAPCECDLNSDSNCDMLDWLVFGQDWGRTDCGTPPGSGSPPNDCECDINLDGNCDMLDWLLFGEDWGRTDCPVF